MFFIADISAQDSFVHSIQWKIGGTLPASAGQMKTLGVAGPVTGVHNNVLIVAGGANFPDSMPWLGGKKKYYNEVFVYKKTNDKLILNKKQFKLPSTVGYAACTSTQKGIVYAGGENENGISNKVFLLQWDKIHSSVIIKNLPNIPLPLTNAAVTSIDNTIYISGGETTRNVSDQFYSLNLENISEGWKQLPSLPHAVSHMVLVALSKNNNNSLYLMAGRKKNANGISDLYSSVFEFDLKKSKWQVKKSLPYALSAGTGIAGDAENILLFGGDKGETFHQSETFTAAINAEKDEVKKQQLIEQKNQLLSKHPGFSKAVLIYNVSIDEWNVVGGIPFDSPVTTTAVKWDNCVLIPSGEIRAGVRTPQILIGEIKIKNK